MVGDGHIEEAYERCGGRNSLYRVDNNTEVGELLELRMSHVM